MSRVADEPRTGLAAVTRTRVRRRLSNVDQLMTVMAAVLLPLGLVTVFLGWYGASHTPYLFEQVPYLVSGGLLGLGLVLTGGFVLFGAWISRAAREQRVLDLELLEAVRGVQDELARLPFLLSDPTPTTPAQRRRRAAGSNGGGPSGDALVATARGSMLHRPDCTVVNGRDDLRQVSGTGNDLQPCQLCDPLGAQRSRT
jgi:hypothetical protein